MWKMKGKKIIFIKRNNNFVKSLSSILNRIPQSTFSFKLFNNVCSIPVIYLESPALRFPSSSLFLHLFDKQKRIVSANHFVFLFGSSEFFNFSISCLKNRLNLPFLQRKIGGILNSTLCLHSKSQVYEEGFPSSPSIRTFSEDSNMNKYTNVLTDFEKFFSESLCNQNAAFANCKYTAKSLPDVHNGKHSYKNIFRKKAARIFSGPMENRAKHSARNIASLANVCAQQIPTKEYLEEFQPRSLRKIKVFDEVPPNELNKFFFKKLDKAYSNPRTILKIYREYIQKDDYPSYNFLLRCFCQLANTFGFNSFWSVRDKQVLHSIPHFKYLVYDLYERRNLIQPKDVCRLLYSMASLEYRSPHLLPTLLDFIIDNLDSWRNETLCNMMLCLALMGIGDNSAGNNVFGNIVDSSDKKFNAKSSFLHKNVSNNKDYSFLIDKICLQLYSLYVTLPSSFNSLTPFDWLSAAFAAAISDLFLLSDGNDEFIPICLKNACNKLSVETLEHSGWNQYYIYMLLYMSDVLKPSNEVLIKKAVPFEMQKNLHLRWLQDILLLAQPQGSELLQTEVDKILCERGKGKAADALINCSVGRDFDEQHCLFASHLIKDKSLALEYDYLLPLGVGRPKASGWIQQKIRLFKALGYNTAVIHKCFWDSLDDDQKEVQIDKLLSKFRTHSREKKGADAEDEVGKKRFKEHEGIQNLRHKRAKFDSWPPDRITI